MTARPRLLIVGPLGLLLLVGSGCGPTQLGAAAIVGDERVTISEIQDTVAATRELQEQQNVIVRGPALAARREVQRRVIDQIFLRTAASLGIIVSAGEVAAAANAKRREIGGPDEFLAALAENGLNPAQVDEVFRSQVLIEKISERLAGGQKLPQTELDRLLQAKLSEIATGMRIKVNPRYGTFDTSAVGLRAALPDYLRPTR